MDLEDAVKLTIELAGKVYCLKVCKSDEEVINSIVKEVNEKIQKFQEDNTKRTNQDCINMALLTYAIELHKIQKKSVPRLATKNKVDEIDALLDLILVSKPL